MSAPWAVALDGSSGGRRELVGGKAASIDRMRALGLPVPPAFVLTTQVCRRYHDEGGHVPDEIWAQVPAFIRQLERETCRTFGGGVRPLLLSVRSGAAVSMPGMMETVLNLGMTKGVERALALEFGDPEFAADTRRRFSAQFQKLTGGPPPGHPWRQLRQAVGTVFASWHSRRAVTYRRERGIPDDGGTAVTIQVMVFGNRDALSGSGVLFTRDPVFGTSDLYGEWLAHAQGEDVVSGRATARPLSELRATLPGAYRDLLAAGERLERDQRDVQDIEFTVESGRLWLLQARAAKRSPRAAVRHAVAMAQEGLIGRDEALGRVAPEQAEILLRPEIDPRHSASATVLARGTAAGPGIGTGRVVVDPAEAEEAVGEAAPVVLARPVTDPDDVPAMAVARAVVTERGGSTSHAAVVCRELAVPCVVGCGPGTVTGLAGKVVTVDGAAGVVYEGALPVIAPDSHEPALRTLTEWARGELGASVGGTLPALLRLRRSRLSQHVAHQRD